MDINIKELTRTIKTSSGEYTYVDLRQIIKGGHDVEEFPFSIRILLENVIRNQNGVTFNNNHLNNILNWKPKPSQIEIPFLPARILMQDFTGVPSIVDIASVRSEAARKHIDPMLINPQVPVDLVIDHSVQIDYYGTNYAYQRNVDLEYERNNERYSLLEMGKIIF